MRFGRRAFLAMMGAAASILGAFPRGPASHARAAGQESLAGAGAANDPFSRDGKSLVACVGGTDLPAMVRKAVGLLGGFGPLALPGKTVLVKPNVVGRNRNPTTTNPAVVGAVVGALYEAGAGKVYVGDMSALVRGSTKRAMEETGILAAARGAGAEVLFFEDHKWEKVPVDGTYLKEVPVSEWVLKADRVVNLPVVKTHAYAGYSICLKNFVGATYFTHRPYFLNPLRWEEVVAELNLAWRPDLNIVDGTKVMVEGGPWEGEAQAANLLLAGRDRVACDAVGLALIKSYGRWKRLADITPWEMGQMRRAVELGLGAKNREALELVTFSLDGDGEFRKRMGKVRSLV